jgi:hypothetical protein
VIFIGQLLYGFCGGVFGRDGYGRKRIEAFGADWVVARGDGNELFFATWNSTEEMVKELAEYSKEEE